MFQLRQVIDRTFPLDNLRCWIKGLFGLSHPDSKWLHECPKPIRWLQDLECSDSKDQE